MSDRIRVNFASTQPTPDEFRALARELFIQLPMRRAMEADYEVAINLLRDIFHAGEIAASLEGE